MLQRQGYVAGHPMAMTQRGTRPSRPMFSSSPQASSPMQGYIPQQSMQYQVVGQVGVDQWCKHIPEGQGVGEGQFVVT